jgi:hypothetical protein
MQSITMVHATRRTGLVSFVVLATAIAGCKGTVGAGGPTVDAVGGGGPIVDAVGGGGPTVDAVGGDAPIADAGSARDSGVVPVGCSPGLLFCDDFESYAVGDKPQGGSTFAENGGTMTVDATRSVSGTKSLKIVTAEGDTAGLSIGAPIFPVAGNNVYGRMMVYFETLPPNGNAWTMVRMNGDAEYYLYGGQDQQFVSIYYPGDCPSGFGPPIPTGRWFCLQWQANGAPDPAGGTKDEARMWLDGVEMSSITVVKMNNCATWTAPTWTNVALGRSYGASTVYYDDWAVDSNPIPCPTLP